MGYELHATPETAAHLLKHGVEVQRVPLPRENNYYDDPHDPGKSDAHAHQCLFSSCDSNSPRICTCCYTVLLVKRHEVDKERVNCNVHDKACFGKSAARLMHVFILRVFCPRRASLNPQQALRHDDFIPQGVVAGSGTLFLIGFLRMDAKNQVGFRIKHVGDLYI